MQHLLTVFNGQEDGTALWDEPGWPGLDEACGPAGLWPEAADPLEPKDLAPLACSDPLFLAL
jgi:hypothetical protein